MKSRNLSRLFTLKSLSLNCQSISLRRESMRLSTSRFEASASPFKDIDSGDSLPVLPLQLALALGQAGHVRPL